jgi:hypothetical protein
MGRAWPRFLPTYDQILSSSIRLTRRSDQRVVELGAADADLEAEPHDGVTVSVGQPLDDG